jgi:putative ABC transport system permease protein
MRGSLTWQALRHRRGQAVVLVLLSTLITAACVIGPLYERAVNQSVVRATLDRAPANVTGLSLHATEDSGPIGPQAILPPAAYVLFGPDTDGEQASIGISFSSTDAVPVTLATRAGICQHLRFVAGACPADAGSVAVSAETARADKLQVGSRLRVMPDPEVQGTKITVPVSVAGVYARFDPQTPYWFGHPYVGPVAATHEQPDALFTGPEYFDATVKLIVDANGAQVDIDRFDDVPLATRKVGVDQIDTAVKGIAQARGDVVGQGGLMDTQLDSLLAAARAGSDQVGQVVPLFAGQLVVLALALLLFVVAAATTQRRPEVALARLRGQRPVAAARLLLAELAVPVLIGIPAGAAVAVGALEVARRVWLPDGVPLGLGRSVLVTLGIALLGQLLVIALVARRLVREPVVSLLRRIPLRGSRIRFGPVEVAVLSLALAGVATVASSGLSGPVTLLAPGLLALAVGMLAGAAVPVLASRLGPWALRRGSVRTALGAFQMARRPGTRGVFVLLVVAVSALVASADCWQVARDNRSARASVEVGAPAVLTARATSVRQLATATQQIDPTGRRMAPVAQIVPPNVGVSMLAVRPAAAAGLAQWGWAGDGPSRQELARLDPPLPAPIELKGGSVDVRLSALDVQGGKPSDLYLDVVDPDGNPSSFDLGPVPVGRTPALALRRAIDCVRGCRWEGLTVVRALTDNPGQQSSLHIDSVTMHAGEDPAAGDGTPVELGPASSWRGSSAPVATKDQLSQLHSALALRAPLLDPPSYALADVQSDGAGLTLTTYSGGDRAGMLHGDVPLRIPALTAGVERLPGQTANTFTAGRLDGLTQTYRSVGTVAAVPGLPGSAGVVDIDLLARLSDRPSSSTTYQVWLADGSPANVKRQTTALGQHGIGVTAIHTTAERAAELNDTGSVWSLRLGLVAGVAGVLVAMAVLVIGVITSLRSRRYDVAALGVSGVSQRITAGATVGEQLALSGIGSLVGALCGVIGSRLLFRAAPYLAGGNGYTLSRVFTAWVLASLAWVVVLILLVLVSLACGRQVMRGAVPAVVREGTT